MVVGLFTEVCHDQFQRALQLEICMLIWYAKKSLEDLYDPTSQKEGRTSVTSTSRCYQDLPWQTLPVSQTRFDRRYLMCD
jgi:hypothetical protein